MKKKLAFILALAAMASTSATAFADNGVVDNDGGSQDVSVKAKYVDELQADKVINADVEWGKMEFTYSVSGTKSWNVKTHDYDIEKSGAWTAEGNEISVTNHSNADIFADFTYEQLTGYEKVTGEFSEKRLSLPSAEGKAVGAAELTGSVTLTLDGELADDVTAMTNVGTAVVSISENKPASVSTWQELVDAAKTGGKIILANNITADESIEYGILYLYKETDLDLGGNTLDVIRINGYKDMCTVKNGNINLIAAIASYEAMTIENCNIANIDDSYPLYNISTMTVKDCKLSGTLDQGIYRGNIMNEGKLTLSGTVIAPDGINVKYSNDVTILAGTYDFDPTEYVDEGAFTVTKNADAGTWSVVKK